MKQPREPDSPKLKRDQITYIGPVSDPVNTALDELPQYIALGCSCPACERETWIDRHALSKKWGNAFLGSLQARLRCRGCGNRLGNRWIMGQLPR